MGDLIDRLKAIDAIDGALLDEVIEGIVIDILLDLPSAHPELNEWCHDCKEYDPEKGCCPRWGQVIRMALEEAQPEIIRCKDCIYFDKGYDEETADWCHAWSETTSEDGYCHNAERGEEKE